MKKQILAPSILALFVASAAHAGATFDTAAGSLYLGGDVEFDYTSKTDVNAEASGRLLVDINGQRVLDNGAFGAFKVNPTYGQQGGTGVDDAWIQFGMKNNWDIKAGHFEATDLSSAGQDTLVLDGLKAAAMYRASDARGRIGDEAEVQVTFTKTLTDTAAFELTVNHDPVLGTDDDGNPTDDGDVTILRPVMTYAADSVSLAVGAEVPVVDQDDVNEWVGFGGTATMQVSDDLALTLRAAYKTGDDALGAGLEGDTMTAGIGAQYQNLYVAALYGEDNNDTNNTDADEIQYYASYKIPAVMDIDNFDIYLAAAYSEGTYASGVDEDVVGGRIRLKYTF